MIWWQILLIGFLLGVIVTSYVLSKTFRDHIHSGIGGLFKGSGKAQKTKNGNDKAAKTERLEECPICHKSSPRSLMTEANLLGTRAKVWIHADCGERAE